MYDRNTVKHLRAILTARNLGFSIKEISELAVSDTQAQQKAAQEKALSLRALIAGLSATQPTSTNCPTAIALPEALAAFRAAQGERQLRANVSRNADFSE